MKKAKRITADPTKGFVSSGRAYTYEDIDQGRVILGVTAHRDGEHVADNTNRCGECIKKFRIDVLGHDVPTPARPSWM